MCRHVYDAYRKEKIGDKVPAWMTELREKQKAIGMEVGPRRERDDSRGDKARKDHRTGEHHRDEKDSRKESGEKARRSPASDDDSSRRSSRKRRRKITKSREETPRRPVELDFDIGYNPDDKVATKTYRTSGRQSGKIVTTHDIFRKDHHAWMFCKFAGSDTEHEIPTLTVHSWENQGGQRTSGTSGAGKAAAGAGTYWTGELDGKIVRVMYKKLSTEADKSITDGLVIKEGTSAGGQKLQITYKSCSNDVEFAKQLMIKLAKQYVNKELAHRQLTAERDKGVEAYLKKVGKAAAALRRPAKADDGEKDGDESAAPGENKDDDEEEEEGGEEEEDGERDEEEEEEEEQEGPEVAKKPAASAGNEDEEEDEDEEEEGPAVAKRPAAKPKAKAPMKRPAVLHRPAAAKKPA
eukprot:348407-Pyramimonas_sp.AAC.1